MDRVMLRRPRPRKRPGPGLKPRRWIGRLVGLPGPYSGVPHVAGWVACGICGDRHVTVVPAVRALDGTECPNCGSMACDAAGS